MFLSDSINKIAMSDEMAKSHASLVLEMVGSLENLGNSGRVAISESPGMFVTAGSIERYVSLVMLANLIQAVKTGRASILTDEPPTKAVTQRDRNRVLDGTNMNGTDSGIAGVVVLTNLRMDVLTIRLHHHLLRL